MTIFFAADHHFQHEKILTFRSEKDFELIRPGFKNIEDHDEAIVRNHNRVVTDNDLTYFLGDVAWKFNSKTKEILQSLNGRKRLVVGNHDDVDWLMDQKNVDGSKIFEKVYLWKYFPEHNLIASHVPLAESDLKRAKFNVHGHIHEKKVKKFKGASDFVNDLRYLNVGMEQSGYTPFSLETVVACMYEDTDALKDK